MEPADPNLSIGLYADIYLYQMSERVFGLGIIV